MKPEQIVWTLENLILLTQELSENLKDLREYFDNELNGEDGGDYIG